MDPETGQIWRHHSARCYVVMVVTNLPDEPKFPKTVVYRDVSTNSVWSRPHREFVERFVFEADSDPLSGRDGV